MDQPFLEVFVHPLSSFSNQVRYIIEYKGIVAREVLVNLNQKPSWFLEMSSSGLVPLLKIHTHQKVYLLNDSLSICEYLDSYPGPSIYPRLENGEVDHLGKALIHNLIQNHAEPITIRMRQLLFTRKIDKRGARDIERLLQILSDALGNDKYFLQN